MSVTDTTSTPSDGGITLRAVTWHDIPELAAIECEVFGVDAWSDRVWWSELASRPRRWYVAATRSVDRRAAGDAPTDSPDPASHLPRQRSGPVLGYAGLDRGGEVADVMTLAVATEAQRRGVGTLLLDALVDAAAVSGATYVMLEVRADNVPAQRLYERKGFSLLTTRRRYYQPGDVDALVLRRTIKQCEDRP